MTDYLLSNKIICELCKKEVELTIHHLIRRYKKVDHKPKINICSACHRQIHTLFDNTYLAQLNSLQLKNEPQMRKFLAWVSKQNPTKRIKVSRKA